MIYLYVKTHNITGLKYFGKTTKSNPERYRGSGKYWKRHIKLHGYDVTIEIVYFSEDEKLCSNFALQFSADHNIVKSQLWANLQEENGIDGAPKGHIGHKFTEEQLYDLSIISKERWTNDDYKSQMSEKFKESWTEERKQRHSDKMTGRKRPDHSEKMKGHIGHTKCRGVKKPMGHGSNVSKSLKDKPKSEEHKENLRKPKYRICRLTDKKEMSVNHYTRWLKSLFFE